MIGTSGNGSPFRGQSEAAAKPTARHAPPAAQSVAVDMRSATLETGAVGARCDKGLLILTGTTPQIGSFTLPGNNYHVYDYALFWGSIRRDATRRLAAWRR